MVVIEHVPANELIEFVRKHAPGSCQRRRYNSLTVGNKNDCIMRNNSASAHVYKCKHVPVYTC